MPARCPTGHEVARSELLSLLCATFLVATAYISVLPVLPLLIRHVSGGSAQAGLVTGAIALGAISLELSASRLLSRFSARATLTTACGLMAGSAMALALVDRVFAMTWLGLTFGAGFGLIVTGISAIIGRVERSRGHVLGLYGLAATLPAIGAPSLALYAESHAGARSVLLAVAIVSFLAIIPLARLRTPAQQAMPQRAFRRALRSPRLILIFMAYGSVTMTYGAVSSFAPFVLDGEGVAYASTFFFVFGVCRAVGRGAAGPLLSRFGEVRLAVPSLVAVAVGLALTPEQHLPLVIAAGVSYGVGYGVIQTGVFVAILDRAGGSVNVASGLWNFGVDAGTGFGALTLAPVGALIGYRMLFRLLPAAVLISLAARFAESHFYAQGSRIQATLPAAPASHV